MGSVWSHKVIVLMGPVWSREVILQMGQVWSREVILLMGSVWSREVIVGSVLSREVIVLKVQCGHEVIILVGPACSWYYSSDEFKYPLLLFNMYKSVTPVVCIIRPFFCQTQMPTSLINEH